MKEKPEEKKKKMEWVAASCCPNLSSTPPSKGNETVFIFRAVAKTGVQVCDLALSSPVF